MHPFIKINIVTFLVLSGVTRAGEHSPHHDFPDAVAGFHDVMAPLWHAPSGEQRAKQICQQYPELIKQHENIRSENIPDGVNPDQWNEAVENLGEVLSPIKYLCENDRTPEYALANVHYGFHELVKLIGHKH